MSHIALEDLGCLAEGRVDAVTRARMTEHLADCRTCMAAYADAVRYYAAWMASPAAFDPSPELIAAAREAADVRPPAVLELPVVTAMEWRRPFPGNAWAASAACALVAALILCSDTIRHPWQEALPGPIRAALESSSAVGLVLPGGENAAASRGRVYRGTGRADDPRLDAALAASIERYESGENGAAEAYAVAAGFMATGQFPAARDLVDEGLSRHPGDPRLLVLAADLAYRSSDLALAERNLREALRHRPQDPVATLNLGLVLAEQGRSAEARRALLSVVAAQPGRPIAERARRELARL